MAREAGFVDSSSSEPLPFVTVRRVEERCGRRLADRVNFPEACNKIPIAFSTAKIRLSFQIAVRLGHGGMNQSWFAPLGDDAAGLRSRLISFGILSFEFVLEAVLILGCSMLFIALTSHGL